MKKIIATDNAPKAIGPYSQAIQIGNTVYTSGQLGINPATGALEEGVEKQAHASLKNIKAILNEAGMDLCDVVKTTVFLQDLADFATVNEIYKEYFSSDFPARSCVQVAKLPMGGLVEIEAVAYKA